MTEFVDGFIIKNQYGICIVEMVYKSPKFSHVYVYVEFDKLVFDLIIVIAIKFDKNK